MTLRQRRNKALKNAKVLNTVLTGLAVVAIAGFTIVSAIGFSIVGGF
jgi:hypothetical protein